jgi:annexin A7/11
MKGLGTDDGKLISIVTRRYPHELKIIRDTYRTKFNRDLVADIHSETSGDYREILEALFQVPFLSSSSFVFFFFS